MTASLPPPPAGPIVVRDWPAIIVTAAVVAALWIIVLISGGGAGDSWVDTLASLVFSIAVLAIAAIPHTRIDRQEVRVRRLVKVWTIPLTDLIGIDVATSFIFRQRIPRLVRMDATAVILPPRAFAWSGMPKANRRAVEEIRARAAALGNDLAVQI